jgi:hypothetical protein
MKCPICHDTGRTPDYTGTGGVPLWHCDCPAGDEDRATNTVLELHYTPEVEVTGNGTRAAEVILKQMQGVRQAAYRHAVAQERLRWQRVLKRHWLFGMACDHAAGTDQPICGCCAVTLPPAATVGDAVAVWLAHVVAVIEQEDAL